MTRNKPWNEVKKNCSNHLCIENMTKFTVHCICQCSVYATAVLVLKPKQHSCSKWGQRYTVNKQACKRTHKWRPTVYSFNLSELLHSCSTSQFSHVHHGLHTLLQRNSHETWLTVTILSKFFTNISVTNHYNLVSSKSALMLCGWLAINGRYDPFHLWIKSMAGRSVWSIVNTCPAAVFYG